MPDGPVLGRERIITLGAPAAELVYALGLGDRIVGRGTWDLWPPALRNLPQVGGAGSPNLELILHLRPDLLVADSRFADLAGILDSHGIPAILFSAYLTQEVIPAVNFLAERLGREALGEELAADLQALLDLTEERLRGIQPEDRPAGLALTGGKGEYFSFSGEDGWRFLNLAGARNLCAGMSRPFPVISREWLALAKPDFALISPYRADYAEEEREAALEKTWKDFTRNSPWPGPAAGGPRVIVLDDLLTFGPRSLAGTLYLAKALHPERFADLDAEKIHADFLRKYFSIFQDGRHIHP